MSENIDQTIVKELGKKLLRGWLSGFGDDITNVEIRNQFNATQKQILASMMLNNLEFLCRNENVERFRPRYEYLLQTWFTDEMARRNLPPPTAGVGTGGTNNTPRHSRTHTPNSTGIRNQNTSVVSPPERLNRHRPFVPGNLDVDDIMRRLQPYINLERMATVRDDRWRTISERDRTAISDLTYATTGITSEDISVASMDLLVNRFKSELTRNEGVHRAVLEIARLATESLAAQSPDSTLRQRQAVWDDMVDLVLQDTRFEAHDKEKRKMIVSALKERFMDIENNRNKGSKDKEQKVDDDEVEIIGEFSKRRWEALGPHKGVAPETDNLLRQSLLRRSQYRQATSGRGRNNRSVKLDQVLTDIQLSGVRNPLIPPQYVNRAGTGFDFPATSDMSNGFLIDMAAGLLGVSNRAVAPAASQNRLDPNQFQTDVNGTQGLEVQTTVSSFDELTSGHEPPDAPRTDEEECDYVAVVFTHHDGAWVPLILHPATGIFLPTDTSNGTGAARTGITNRNKAFADEFNTRKEAMNNAYAMGNLKLFLGGNTNPPCHIFYVSAVRKRRARNSTGKQGSGGNK